MIDGGKRVKYVLSAKPSDITADEIVSFVDSVTSGKAKEYKIDEEVVYSDDTKVEDELWSAYLNTIYPYKKCS